MVESCCLVSVCMQLVLVSGAGPSVNGRARGGPGEFPREGERTGRTGEPTGGVGERAWASEGGPGGRDE